ncbi:MAG: glycosyltransferase family 4 protein [bacterium]
MPKIAFVLESFYGDHIGGAERQVQMLGEALRGEGWETCYLCERSADKSKRESIQGMDVYAIPVRRKLYTWLNWKALFAAVKECQADLYYQRVRHPYTGLAVRAAHRLQKPIIWAAASLADVIRKDDLRFTRRGGHPVNGLLHIGQRWIEDQGILQMDKIILQTEEQKRLLLENYGRDGKVIPNHLVVGSDGVIPKRTPPQILWLSNIKPFKRADLFIQLAERCRDLCAEFVMVGGCQDRDFSKKIEQFSEKNPHFTYLGPLEPIQSEKCIAEATLLVNTSSFEGFPNAFQQAWYYGVPVLSLGVDPDQLIESKRLGHNAHSLNELETALRRLLKNEQERSEIAARAKAFTRKEFDLKKLLPEYIELFEGLLK